MSGATAMTSRVVVIDIPHGEHHHASMQHMNNFPQLVFNLRDQLNKFGAVLIHPLSEWRRPSPDVTDDSKVITSEVVLPIAPFSNEAVIEQVGQYEAGMSGNKAVSLQDADGKILEFGLSMKTKLTSVKVYREVILVRTDRILSKYEQPSLFSRFQSTNPNTSPTDSTTSSPGFRSNVDMEDLFWAFARNGVDSNPLRFRYAANV